MGLPSARRKRTNIGQTRPAAGPIPGSAIPVRSNNPVGFDKTRPPAVERPLTIAAALRLPIAGQAAIEPFSQGRFTARLVATAELGAERQLSAAIMHGASITPHVYGAAGALIGANRGNVAVIFAITLVPVLGLIGAAIDYSRINSARSSMQAALDSTALMLSRDLSQGLIAPSEINARAQSYFAGLYNSSYTKPVAITTNLHSRRRRRFDPSGQWIRSGDDRPDEDGGPAEHQLQPQFDRSLGETAGGRRKCAAICKRSSAPERRRLRRTPSAIARGAIIPVVRQQKARL